MGQSIQEWTKENLWKIKKILLGPFVNTLPHMLMTDSI